MRNKPTTRFSARKRLIVVAISACFAAAPAWSNPTAPQVVNGSASFNQAGKLLTVTNSNGAIINWNSFSIGAGETTRFNQASAASSVLNRVIANDPSVLLGTLSSNGRVWLVNPAGIMVGQGARIDVARFIASTLNVRNEDFLAGRLNFGATPNAGSIRNYGQITTPSGGSVYLIAPAVENHGIINAPNGEVILAAGQTAQLIDTGTPGVKVDITGAEGNATNLGGIVAEAGRIGMAGVLVKNSGTLNASSVVKEGGRIFLKASQDAYVDGKGRIVATGTKGGSVEVLGNRVAVMDQAQLDASGNTGGGQILVGGDYQGKNPEVQNASVTYIGPQASLKADATQSGDGGKVIVWSDDTTRAFGTISAKGGTQSGDGGFVETSGLHLETAGIRVDASAPRGQAGSWLLDPNDIQIINGDGTDANVTNAGGIWNTSSDSAIVYGGNIAGVLNGGTSVVIQTGTSSLSTQYGDITMSGVTLGVTPANDTSLTLKAHRNIVITDSSISSTGHKLGVTLNAHYANNTAVGNVQISNSSINTNGGAVVIGGGDDPKQIPAIGYYGGSPNTNHGVYMNSASINTYGGDVTLSGAGSNGGYHNVGVYLYGYDGGEGGMNMQIATGGGNLDITGVGGDGGEGRGIETRYATLDTSLAGSTGGAVTLDGRGGGTGDSNYGIYLNYTTILTGGGEATLTGTGGNGTYGNGGGYLYGGDGGEGANMRIATGGGALTIVGTGGGAGGSGAGIYSYHADLDTSKSDNSTGGKITLTGTGSNGTGSYNEGVVLNQSTSIMTDGGNLEITGVGGDGGEGRGIGIYSATLDTSKGDGGTGGAITLNGSGGNGPYESHGVYLDDASIATGGGALSITGTGGGTGSNNVGIYASSQAKLDTSKGDGTGGGDVVLTGTGGGGTEGVSNHGIRLDGSEMVSARDLSLIGLAGAGTGSSDIYVSGKTVLRADSDGTGSGTVNFGTSSVLISSGESERADIYYNPVGYTDAATKSDANGDPYAARIDGTYTAWMLVNDANHLQAMNTNLVGNYALGKHIDASAATGFAPVGNDSTRFAGQFDGLDHTISNLAINLPGASEVGLFGVVHADGAVRNVGLVGGSVKGSGNAGSLAGINYGTISNAWASANVDGGSTLGGLVGANYGSVSNSYAAGNVTGTAGNVGGLVGYNGGGSITNSYASGAVIGASGNVGGLLGHNESGGSISYSYAIGSVNGSTQVGGLVGRNNTGSSISNTYAAGSVTGTGADVGGLVGINSGTVSSSFWDTGNNIPDLPGIGGGTISGATGLTTTNAMLSSSYAGWNFGSSWWMSDGNTRPFLRSEWSTTIHNAHQLQLMATNLSASYKLSHNIDMQAELASGMWNTATGFVPVGNKPNYPHYEYFTGQFDGMNHTISDLVINRPSDDYVGLFGYVYSGSVVKNVGLVDGSVTGGSYVGALAGRTYYATIKNSFSSGSVDGTYYVGGLAGYNYNGTIGNSYSTGGVDGSSNVGGLAGYSYYGTISNSYSMSTVNGSSDVGGLVGRQHSGTISKSHHTTGNVTGTGDGVGGLVGSAEWSFGIYDSYATGKVTSAGGSYVGGLIGRADTASDTVSGSYATGDVEGMNYVGGLVGYSNEVTIKNAYATGKVTGSSYVGGLVGYNNGSIDRTYSTGAVVISGGSSVGGLVGYDEMGCCISNSYWDKETSGQLTSAGGEGKTTADMKQLATFSGWSIADTGGSNATWRIYEGNTTPLLRSFVKPLTVTANAASRTYDGSAYFDANGVTYSVANPALSGTLAFNDSSTHLPLVNAGSYTISAAGLWSDQQGYDISYASGALTINPYAISLSGSRVYDGTLNVAAGALTLGTLVGSETLTLTGIGTVANKNAGAAKAVALGTLTLGNGTGLASNYTFSGGTHTANITQAALTLSTTDVTKTYDGGLAATGTAVVTSGTLFSGDTLSGGSFAFTDKNVGIDNKTVTTTAVAVNDGNSGSNYNVSYTNNTTSTVNPYTVSLSGSRTYDGTLDVAAGAFALGTLVGSETLTLTGTGTVANKNVGAAKAVTLGTLTLGNGTGLASNYSFSGGTHAASITARPLNVVATGVPKVYDGLLSATATLSDNRVTGDALSFDGSANFLDKNVGVAKTVNVSGITLTGADAGNYSVNTTAATSADITVRPLSTWIGGASGDWSVAANWDALPDLSNVLAVTVPTGTTVTYDAAAGTTNLASLTTGGLNIAGGSLNIANSLTVNSSFSKSGGTLGDFGAGSSANITQATGDLDLPAITVANLSLKATAGAITQSGPITALALKTQSQGATTLTNPDNQVSGRVDMTAGGPLKLWASGDLTLGVIDAGANEVEIKAGGAILQALGTETSTNIIASLANLTSVFGGASGGLAINTNTQITGALTATVGAEADFGGIRIQNSGLQPASLTLVDNALAGAGVSFLNTGNITSTAGYTLQTRTGGDLALLSNGNLTWDGGNLSTPGGSVQISADGTLDITGALSSPVDLALSSTNSINVSGSVITQGTGTAAFTAPSVAINGSVNAADDVGIIANTINLGAGSSTRAGHDVILAAANVLATNASVAADHDISAAVTGELRLNGSGFTAGNDIFINMLGATSTLYLNDTAGLPRSFLWAQAPSTIHLDFPARASGGLVVDGVAVDPLKFATTAGGSGLFYGATEAPATFGAGLELAYVDGTALPDTAVEPTVVDAVVAAISAVTTPASATTGPTPSPTLDLNALPPTAAGGGPGAEGTVGTEGTFGAANGSEKGEEKDKDKNKKDEETGLKKQADKPAAKKLATCS